jgi:hypothetical protein
MKNIKRILSVLAIALISGVSFGQGQFGNIKGKFIERDSSAIISAYVWLETSGGVMYTLTDLEGEFELSPVPPGSYDVFVSYLEDTTSFTINLKPDQTYQMGARQITKMMKTVDIYHDKYNFIEAGEELKHTLTAEDLKHNTNLRDIGKLIGSMSSDIKVASDGELYFRGARKGNMLYLVDGVKQSNFNSVPGVAIQSMTVYTGGLPAKYGDTTGGVVVMETKSYFDLYRAWEMAERRRERAEKLENAGK